MDVCVGHLHAEDGHADALARHSGLDGHGDALGEERQRRVLLVREVEDVVDLVLGDAERVTLGQRVDVEEGEVMLVFGNLVAGDLPGDDA